MSTLDNKSISPACPVSGDQRDNTIARLVALATLLVATTVRALIALDHIWPAVILMMLLTADFAIRAFYCPKFSPLASGGRVVSTGLRLPTDPVAAAPRIFAARIGLVLSLATVVLLSTGQTATALVVAAILAICAFLESVFSFCPGCWIYALLPSRLGSLLSRQFAV